MAAKAKRAAELKKREKRSKILLGVLGVMFLAVGVIEVPSIMSQLNKKPPPGTTYDPGPTSGASTGLPNVAGSTASTGIAANGQLVNSDVPPAPADGGQLVSFSMFQSKNPFVPQVTDSASPTDTSPPPASTDTGGATATPKTAARPVVTTVPTTTTPAAATPAGGIVPPASTTPTTPTTTTPATTTATPTTTASASSPTVSISVNGVVSKVATGGTFPTSHPVFRLAGWSKGSAQVAIVGGSYATGEPTLTLKQGATVTLENTTDGKRFRLLLLSTPSG